MSHDEQKQNTPIIRDVLLVMEYREWSRHLPKEMQGYTRYSQVYIPEGLGATRVRGTTGMGVAPIQCAPTHCLGSADLGLALVPFGKGWSSLWGGSERDGTLRRRMGVAKSAHHRSLSRHNFRHIQCQRTRKYSRFGGFCQGKW